MGFGCLGPTPTLGPPPWAGTREQRSPPGVDTAAHHRPSGARWGPEAAALEGRAGPRRRGWEPEDRPLGEGQLHSLHPGPGSRTELLSF